VLHSILRTAVQLVALVAVWFASSPAARASHLVTGNGFGFAVVAPETGAATKFYPHPYSFVRSDPANPLKEGIETANFIKKLGWGGGRPSAVEYVQDSHVIRMSRFAAARIVEAPPLAGTIGRLAIARAARGETPAPGAIRPLYVRRPDAEIDRDRKLEGSRA